VDPGYHLSRFPIIGVNLLTCNLRSMPEMKQWTEFCLQSLRESDLLDFPHYIVVVDNGSDDGTVEWLQAQEGLFVLPQGKNVGIAQGRNIGHRHLLSGLPHRPEYIVEIHNDHLFPGQWLRPLVCLLEEDQAVGIACSSLVTNKGYFGSPVLSIMPSMGYRNCRTRVEQQAARMREPVVKPGLQHPCLKRVSVMEQVGLYDEGMVGSNWEDVEDCYRWYKAGHQIMVHRGSVVYHYYCKSRQQIEGAAFDDHFYRNKERYYALHPEDAHLFLILFSRWLEPRGGVYDRAVPPPRSRLRG